MWGDRQLQVDPSVVLSRCGVLNFQLEDKCAESGGNARRSRPVADVSDWMAGCATLLALGWAVVKFSSVV